jgi:site-specific DNA-methyltransferase (adenine-specific)
MLPDAAWSGACQELHRVLRPDRHAYVACDRRSHPVFALAATAAGFRIAATLVWDKMSVGLGRGAHRAQHELVLFLEKGHRDPNRRDLGDVLSIPPVVRGYPTEKPVALWKILIGQSTQPGELIFDPFCGSGSVGVAAREPRRRALVCDINASTAVGRLRVAAVAVEGAAA